MQFIKGIFVHFYNDSRKYSIVWGACLALYVSIAISSKPDALTLIEKLNATGHFWKIMLVIFAIAFVIEIVKFSTRKPNNC
jgi:hypothetical protein